MGSSTFRAEKGLTLIETLVFLAIIALIATVLAATTTTLNRVTHSNIMRQSRLERLKALQVISDQLYCAVPMDLTNSAIFSIEVDEFHPDSDVLRFGLNGFDSRVTAARWRSALIKEYCVSEKDVGILDLVCRTRPLRGPASVNTGVVEVVAKNIKAFVARANADGEWFDQWDTSTKRDLPQCVELSLIYSGRSEMMSNSVTILIPAGNVVTSRFDRAGAGGL